MTKFVVLAAGRGSRMGRLGDVLPKCLVPFGGKALLTHQFELAPRDAELIVVTGYRAELVREYVRLAHGDNLDVRFVHDERWGAGPGVSLLAARDTIGDDDLVWVACDTLWDNDQKIWETSESWLAIAPMPAGTPIHRWCRVELSDDDAYVLTIHDKTTAHVERAAVSTALGCVIAEDLPTFWLGLEHAESQVGEIQFSAGLDALLHAGYPIATRRIAWLDVGDEQAYRTAKATFGKFDPSKPNQVTYVVDNYGAKRVVKFHENPTKIQSRYQRGQQLDEFVSKAIEPCGVNMVAYPYVDGTVAQYLADDHGINVTEQILDLYRHTLWTTQLDPRPPNWYETTMKFYYDKTLERVNDLSAELRPQALDAVYRVDWSALVNGCVPGVFHGDMTYANLIGKRRVWNAATFNFYGIDWREDFVGETTWGDLRYDLGKLLSGTVFNWEAANHGDFSYWELGPKHREFILNVITKWFDVDARAIEIIAALCLINSAPLHNAPMDEILVARGTRWLTELTR